MKQVIYVNQLFCSAPWNRKRKTSVFRACQRHDSEPSPVVIYCLIFHKLFHILGLILSKCKIKTLIPSLSTSQGSRKETVDRKKIVNRNVIIKCLVYTKMLGYFFISKQFLMLSFPLFQASNSGWIWAISLRLDSSFMIEICRRAFLWVCDV